MASFGWGRQPHVQTLSSGDVVALGTSSDLRKSNCVPRKSLGAERNKAHVSQFYHRRKNRVSGRLYPPPARSNRSVTRMGGLSMEVGFFIAAFLIGYASGCWLTVNYVTDTQQIFYVAEVNEVVNGVPTTLWVVGPPLLPECEWTRRYVNTRHLFFHSYPHCVTRRWCRMMQKAGRPGSIYRKWVVPNTNYIA